MNDDPGFKSLLILPIFQNKSALLLKINSSRINKSAYKDENKQLVLCTFYNSVYYVTNL